MPASLRELLLVEFSEEQDPPTRPLTDDDVYEVAGLLDTGDLLPLAGAGPARRCKDPAFHPATPAAAARAARNIFDVIREGDMLLHHPYDSFSPASSASSRRPPRIPTCWPSS